MVTISALLADPSVRGWYLVVCCILFALPLIALTIWYHRRINQTAGGRALMKRQNQSRDKGLFAGDAVSLSRDINSGQYGEAVKVLQRKLYWLIGLWIVLNAVTFGILIWADEVNRIP